MIEFVVAVRPSQSLNPVSQFWAKKAVAKWTLACHNMTSGLGGGSLSETRSSARSIGLLEAQLCRKRVLLCT